MTWPAPDPPLWALAAGLPEPHEGEEFIAYVERLGISKMLGHWNGDPNFRLNAYLQCALPDAFRHHCGQTSYR